jgi:undecaprenyl diphosphate synthase
MLNVAFNYGGRNEILEATRRLAREVASGKMTPDDIDETAFESMLQTAGEPDPDLIVRTSGEMRLSNFLPWQSAYSELVFLPIHWPDFDKVAFAEAVETYAKRDRRFGGIAPQAMTA